MNFLGMLRPLEILDDMFPFLFAYAYYDMLVCGDMIAVVCGTWVLSLFWLNLYVASARKLIFPGWSFVFMKVLKKYSKLVMNCL